MRGFNPHQCQGVVPPRKGGVDFLQTRFCSVVVAKALGNAEPRPVGEVTFSKQVTDPTVVLNWVALAVERRAAGHASKLKSKTWAAVFGEGRHKVLRRPSGSCPGPSRGGFPFSLALGFLARSDPLFFFFWAWLEWSINVDLIAVVVPCRCVSACRSQFAGQLCSVLYHVRRGGVGSNGACVCVRVGRNNDDGSSMALECICECFLSCGGSCECVGSSAAFFRCFFPCGDGRHRRDLGRRCGGGVGCAPRGLRG